MAWGKCILIQGLFLALVHGGLMAGDMPDASPATGLVSFRRNAVVSIGGEIATDYTYRKSRMSGDPTSPATSGSERETSGLALRHATLRLQADVHPNVRAFLKLDLASPDELRDDEERLVEEALVVMSAVGGTGLGFFAGKGRAPYGQDITLGLVQSYHHMANQADSSEGPIFIGQGHDDASHQATPANPGKARPLMRPGQFDRVFMVGAAYEWADCWRVELAAFQPTSHEYRNRLRDDVHQENSADIGVAGRIWWRPFEELTLELSGIMARSRAMSRTTDRTDLAAGADGTSLAYAVSVGFDWQRGPWQVFGEYQRGRDWNFTKGYQTDTLQLGTGYHATDRLRFGLMAESLRVRTAEPERVTHQFYKLTFNMKYDFGNGFFILAEYGREWQRRSRKNAPRESGHGDFFGIRVGFSF